MNRTISPGFHKITTLQFPPYQKELLSSGIPVYTLAAGTEPVIRLDFIFQGGLAQQHKMSQSGFTASMLSEGTPLHNAKALAEALDYYGSYFQTRSNADDAVATLYCLEKHFKACLPLFMEALTQSIFPSKELEIQKKNSIQKLKVNEKKNSFLCRRLFYQTLWGKEHPYAAFSTREDIEQILPEDLIAFHNEAYLGGLNYVLLSGMFGKETKDLLHTVLQDSPFRAMSNDKGSVALQNIPGETGKFFLEKEGSVQSAIRIGKKTIGRSHPDYRKLQFLNLIFGGYFGSRLMKNIREDKGLTYGIYSVLESFKGGANWYIESEINNKNQEKGVEEIYKELTDLHENLIPEQELNTARNYYIGAFLRGLDGPFSLADRLKIIIDNKLPDNYYQEFVDELYAVNATILQTTAIQYLNHDSIVEAIVGKK